MQTTLVDSNVILDIVTQDDEWLNWSASALERSAAGRLVINPVIYAEVSIGFSTIEELEDAVRSCAIGGAAAPASIRCQTSTSARTPCWRATPCSPETRAGIARISPSFA